MTFIIAIQLEDSVIITSDTRSLKLSSDGSYSYEDLTSKLTLWKHGVIAGTGEVTVIDRAVEFFVKISKMNIEDLPKCLKISRLIRELEADHEQITGTKLLYSHQMEDGQVSLNAISPDGFGDYIVRQYQKNEILIWLFNPNYQNITADLQDLYSNLKPLYCFADPMDWFNFYMGKLRNIYTKQSQIDQAMSKNFNYFFHSPNICIHGHSESNSFFTSTVAKLNTLANPR